MRPWGKGQACPPRRAHPTLDKAPHPLLPALTSKVFCVCAVCLWCQQASPAPSAGKPPLAIAAAPGQVAGAVSAAASGSARGSSPAVVAAEDDADDGEFVSTNFEDEQDDETTIEAEVRRGQQLPPPHFCFS